MSLFQMAKDSEKWREKEAIVYQKCVSSFDESPSRGLTNIPASRVTHQRSKEPRPTYDSPFRQSVVDLPEPVVNQLYDFGS
jgi:hypothetical protein